MFSERLETSPAILASAIDWATANGLRLLNLSLGTTCEEARNLLYLACARAIRAGAIIVAAAGSTRAQSYPACFNDVLSVGATKAEDVFQYWANPDGDVEFLAAASADQCVNGKWHTSYSAPLLTGIIALLLQRDPDISLSDVRAQLRRYASNPT